MAIIQGKEKLISFMYSSIYFYRLVKKTLVSRLFSLIAFFFRVEKILADSNVKGWVKMLTLLALIKNKYTVPLEQNRHNNVTLRGDRVPQIWVKSLIRCRAGTEI